MNQEIINEENLIEKAKQAYDYADGIQKANYNYVNQDDYYELTIVLSDAQRNCEVILTDEIKDYFFYDRFDSEYVYDVARGTSKENELFDYAEIPSYYKEYKDEIDKDDDIEMGL